MFWVRPEALAPLRELKLAESFPEEKGLLDGGLEHVTERLFGAAVVAAGYRLADGEGFGVAAGPGPGAEPQITSERDLGEAISPLALSRKLD